MVGSLHIIDASLVDPSECILVPTQCVLVTIVATDKSVSM